MGRAIAPVNSRQAPAVTILDHLAGAGQQNRRNRQAERLRDLEVDNQLELRRLLDREIGRWAPFKTLATKPAARRYMSG